MPISDCEVRDPRIRRTRQLLQGALDNLMQTKSFDEISVQDIAEAATVNRATFYDHYTDKFGLLEAMVAGGFHRLLQERHVTFDGTCPQAVGSLVLAACDYLTQRHSGSACQRQAAYQPMVDAALTGAIYHVLIRGIPQKGSQRALSQEMIGAAASSALYGAVKQWFTTPGHTQAEKIVRPIVELVLPLLEGGAAKTQP